jgi:hypothetical protein
MKESFTHFTLINVSQSIINIGCLGIIFMHDQDIKGCVYMEIASSYYLATVVDFLLISRIKQVFTFSRRASKLTVNVNERPITDC